MHIKLNKEISLHILKICKPKNIFARSYSLLLLKDSGRFFYKGISHYKIPKDAVHIKIRYSIFFKGQVKHRIPLSYQHKSNKDIAALHMYIDLVKGI